MEPGLGLGRHLGSVWPLFLIAGSSESGHIKGYAVLDSARGKGVLSALVASGAWLLLMIN